MKFGIDITPLQAGKTGVGQYTSLLKAMATQAPDDDFAGLAATTRALDLTKFDNSTLVRHIKIPTRAMYALWNTLKWPTVERLLGDVDVFHGTNYYLPPVKKCGTALTIHDL
ncbi:glycosyltransferase family 1 protein, partial [Candidatus Hydrogenedentota bacterium]